MAARRGAARKQGMIKADARRSRRAHSQRRHRSKGLSHSRGKEDDGEDRQTRPSSTRTLRRRHSFVESLRRIWFVPRTPREGKSLPRHHGREVAGVRSMGVES